MRDRRREIVERILRHRRSAELCREMVKNASVRRLGVPALWLRPMLKEWREQYTSEAAKHELRAARWALVYDLHFQLLRKAGVA